MSTIDWSKAPEGATHFGPYHDFLVENWFKRDECGWSIWECTRWAVCRGGLQKLREETMVQRPPQQPWDGSGLPPVGVVCEINMKAGTDKRAIDVDRYQSHIGEEVEIVAHHDIGGGCSAAVYAIRNGFTFEYHSLIEGNFRPVRTPEQIAAEEREKARDEVLNAMAANMAIEKNETLWQHRLQVVGEMLDMGYRKQVMP